MGWFRMWVWVVGWSRMRGKVRWEMLQGVGDGVGASCVPKNRSVAIWLGVTVTPMQL